MKRISPSISAMLASGVTPTQSWWDHLHENKAIWARAMANCPAHRLRASNMGTFYGQQACLAHLLGYRNGNGVYNAWNCGSVPKGQRLKLLLLFAGPDGHIWVKLRMLELKMDPSKYKMWPAFEINALSR